MLIVVNTIFSMFSFCKLLYLYMFRRGAREAVRVLLVFPQIAQICTDGYATGCYLWNSVGSVGGYYIRFAHGLSRRLRRFAQMATLLDVICGILWKSVGG